jgi:hypothetical protein
MNDASNADFQRKLYSARHGDRIIYFRGDLMFERFKEAMSTPAFKRARPIHNLARAVWKEYERNRCLLFQRRVGKSCWEYIAVKV